MWLIKDLTSPADERSPELLSSTGKAGRKAVERSHALSRVLGSRLMPDKEPDSAASLRQRQMALSGWDKEGGAGPGGPQGGSVSAQARSEIPELTNAELVQLRIRVIALENLVIALLAEASERQLGLAREMATYISPNPGFPPHPLTIQAAGQMISLVERAGHFRTVTRS